MLSNQNFHDMEVKLTNALLLTLSARGNTYGMYRRLFLLTWGFQFYRFKHEPSWYLHQEVEKLIIKSKKGAYIRVKIALASKVSEF